MIRRFGARVDVLRNGVKLTELQFSDAPSISADSRGKIKTSMTGGFKYNPLVNYFKDELRPVIIIDGIESNVGIYRIGTLTRRFNTNGVRYDEIDAYDRGFALTQRKIEGIKHIAAGTGYIPAIEQLLTDAGITQKIISPSTATLQTDREDWAIGTEYIIIVNQLLEEINYKSIWFNSEGYAIIEPKTEPSVELINHCYDATTELSVTYPDCSTETDIFSKPNVFVAICSNADLPAPLIATAINDNPNSALSITSRGIRIPQIYKVDNIACQSELQTYINGIRNQSMYSTETVTVKTAIMPGHGIGDTIAINHPAIQGIFEETSWRFALAAGEAMTHKLKRVMKL